jgi:hypothetical protein
MKQFTTLDTLTFLGILALIVLLLGISGCNHRMYLQGHRIANAGDPRKCCQRLSLHHKQMAQFTRYCKVALFLSKSEVASIGTGVKENAATAVKVCKFVFGVETDEDLVAAGDEQEYYRVQSYIVLPENEMGWRKTLDCDPHEPACEEF